MRITRLSIENFRSFGTTRTGIAFNTSHTLLVGKNNAGKSNILSALAVLLGTRNPQYIRLTEDDFFDTTHPVRIEVEIAGVSEDDRKRLFSLPELTKIQKGALSKKKLADIQLLMSFERSLGAGFDDDSGGVDEDEEKQKKQFELKLWGFQVFRHVEDLRKALARMILVPAIRDANKELTGTQWTYYGQLVRTILEDSPHFETLKTKLKEINAAIQEIFAKEKAHLLSGARVVSYVEDISFQLTRDGNPADLLRNLEVYLLDNGMTINIDRVGTGTQSAVIIGILELALKQKASRHRLLAIEEPEIFIHPHGIRYLGDLLRNIVEDGSTQVIASTHSPLLAATFSPREIIRVGKHQRATTINQPAAEALSDLHFRRFINAESAEMFFSDGVILVEGDTEKHILGPLSKQTLQDQKRPELGTCEFDKANIAVVRLLSKDNILNFVQILEAFDIKYTALLDRDVLTSRTFKDVCLHFNVDHSDNDKAIKKLQDAGVYVNPHGEIEDMIPDSDLVDTLIAYEVEQNPELPEDKAPALRTLLAKKVSDVKSAHPNKTSEAFESLLSSGKAAYAIRFAEHYLARGNHPFENLIRVLFNACHKR